MKADRIYSDPSLFYPERNGYLCRCIACEAPARPRLRCKRLFTKNSNDKMKEIQTKPVVCFRRWCRKGYAAFASLHREVTIGVLAVGMSILLLANNGARAAEADTLTIDKVMRIDEVAIVGSNSSPTRSTMTQTTLFDRVASAAAPLTTLESALRLSPSIDVRERSGKGAQADFSIRGGSFDQTMILLNGIDFTDARTGHQTHSLPVDLDCVARIRLIDGMTGVGAYAGAVDIRTQPLRPRYLRLEASGGGDGYAYGNLSGALAKGPFTAFAAASYRRSDGYMHNTGFDNANAYARLTCDSPRAGFIDAQGGYQVRRFGANGFYSLRFPDQWEETSTGIASFRWVKGWERWTLGASVAYRKNIDRFELVRGRPEEVPYNFHNTDHAGATLWVDCRSRAGVTTLGGDYAYDHIWSTVLGCEVARPNGRYDRAGDRSVGNLWLRHVKSFRRFDTAVSAGAAMTPFGGDFLWSLSAGYRPGGGWRLEAGAAQSMRLPTFTDLYYTATGYRSNSDLKPERAVTYRLTADYAVKRWSASLTTYYRDGRRIIDWVRPAADADWQSMQLTELGTFGAEFAGGYRAERGFIRRVTVAYAYITTSKQSEGMISNYATDYLKHKASLSIETRFLREFSFVVTGTLYDRNGNYADREGRVVPYEPFFLLDGRLAWSHAAWSIYFDATNLTDAHYYDFGGLSMPGLWLGAGFAVTIG